jgi:hypothetical protein
MSQPASFLTFPRELRQMVLSYSFNEMLIQDMAFDDSLNLIDIIFNCHGAPSTHTWATTLSTVDPSLTDDLSTCYSDICNTSNTKSAN